MTEYKIYRVTVSGNSGLGYDSYSEFMIVAKSEDEARNMHPGTELPIPIISDRSHNAWVRIDQLHLLKVEEIGIADENHQQTEVLTTSFHAG